MSQRSAESLALEREAVSLSQDNPRYGYRRITALFKREGHKVNEKRVQAVRRRHGLQVRKKQRRTRRVQENESKRLSASRRNQVWSWDFVHDQTDWADAERHRRAYEGVPQPSTPQEHSRQLSPVSQVGLSRCSRCFFALRYLS